MSLIYIRFDMVSPYGFVLLLEEIVSLLRFPFLSHVHFSSCEISLVSHLKRPYSCFSSHLCFLVTVVPLVLFWAFTTLFPCCLSIRLFCYDLSVPIFCSKIFLPLSHPVVCPVGWGCRRHRLLLCRGVRPPPNECPGYDTKQSSLSSLPGPLWPGVVALDKALLMG